MILHELQDLSNSYAVDLLRQGVEEARNTDYEENYLFDHANKPSNIFYLLKNGRYANGKYFVLEDENGLAAASGWNMYDDSTALIFSRSFIPDRHKSEYLMSKYFFSKMIAECGHVPNILMSFNKRNPGLYKWIVRYKETGRWGNFPELFKNFEPLGLREIYYTEQFAARYKMETHNAQLYR